MINYKQLPALPVQLKDDQLWLSSEEVGALLRVSPRIVCRYSKEGDLKSYRIGKRRLFSRSDVDAYIRGRSCSPKVAQLAA